VTVGYAPAIGSGAQTTKERDRRLTREERRTLALLGAPTLGLALSVTTVTAYLPKVASGFVSSSIVIGVLVGGEGLIALGLPLVVGTWSDTLETRFGGRLPFVLAGVPVMALALLGMGFVGSIGAMAVAVFVFFVAYFTAYEPYRALYPDLLPDEIEGKAQSTQAVWRGLGTGCALTFGGLLLAAGQPAPFVCAALVLLAAVGAFVVVTARQRDRHRRRGANVSGGVRARARELADLIREHPALRLFLFANALWELALGAIKTFVVLYMTVGLGLSLPATGGVLAAVAVMILSAALVGGKLGDRLGRGRVMRAALWVYGLGLVVPFLVESKLIVALAVPFVAFGGGVLMALPYALLTPLMPEDRHGALTGYYSLSRGLGTLLGPLLAGLAIELLSGPLSWSAGYSAIWGVASAAALASLPLLGRLRDQDEDRRELARA
jgi:MFS family permease